VRPPAVPVGELLDVVDRTVRLEDADQPARDRIVTHHPLQPFDRRNFTPGELVPGRPWSFDAVALEGARAMAGDRRPPPPFLAGALPAPAAGVLALDDLVAFVQHPARAFLRQRLGIRLGQLEEEPDDALPVELDALEEWGVGQRLLDGRLAGAEAEACVAAEIARGILPPGGLADPILRRVRPVVERLVAEAASLPGAGGEPASAEVAVTLPDGRRLVGGVPGVVGDVLRTVTYSRVGPRQRLAAWVRLVALAAARPDRRWTAVTVGRRRRGGREDHTVTVATAGPLDAREARGILAALVDLHDRGMCEALPLACGTSAAYARAVLSGKDPRTPADREWTSDWAVPREDADPEHELVLGGRRPLEALFGEPPGPGESGPGWEEDEPSRFGRYALRLWEPLLAHEALVDR
jgi:exodeoxyribonuclease V gamma subunit